MPHLASGRVDYSIRISHQAPGAEDPAVHISFIKPKADFLSICLITVFYISKHGGEKGHCLSHTSNANKPLIFSCSFTIGLIWWTIKAHRLATKNLVTLSFLKGRKGLLMQTFPGGNVRALHSVFLMQQGGQEKSKTGESLWSRLDVHILLPEKCKLLCKYRGGSGWKGSPPRGKLRKGLTVMGRTDRDSQVRSESSCQSRPLPNWWGALARSLVMRRVWEMSCAEIWLGFSPWILQT